MSSEDKLPLNVLLTRRCNASCAFCIEKTVVDIQDKSTAEDFIQNINFMLSNNMVSDVLLLGGEPLYFRGILDVIDKIGTKPIITTNAHRLVFDLDFRKEFIARNDKIKALNISIPHYNSKVRDNIMGYKGFTNHHLRDLMNDIDGRINVRINTPIIKEYIQTEEDISSMAEFVKHVGAIELKMVELTGKDKSSHTFIRPEVLQFNTYSYAPIPDTDLLIRCHKFGGTLFWKYIKGIRVYFNAPPDNALCGGMDSTGKYYHRVLFNDGKIGFSWNRADGLLTMDEVRKYYKS